MATKAHKPIAWGALASITLAVAIGSAPVVALLTLQQPLASVEWAQ